MPTFGDGELAWTNSNRKSIKKITVEYNGLIGKEPWRAHPTQKPLKLFTKIVSEYSKEGTLFLIHLQEAHYPSSGQGFKQKGTGIEIEEKYCEIAVERLRQEVLAL